MGSSSTGSADSARHASPHRPASHAARAASSWSTMTSLSLLGEECLADVLESADEHPHLGDAVAIESVDERVVRLEGLAVAAERRVLPLGDPVALRDAVLLIELDVAAGRLEEIAEGFEQASDSLVVPGEVQG